MMDKNKKKKNEREYRIADIHVEERDAESSERSYMIEGYASTYDRYELFEMDGVKYYEQVSKDAFNKTDMKDVVFRIDHEGPVYARSSNNSVSLLPDEKGLKVSVNLGLTTRSRQIYEDIKAGMYRQMSFAFTVDGQHFDKETHTRCIDSFNKIYDISAVTFPANPNTYVHARDYLNGEIEAVKEAERLHERDQKRLHLLLKL